jgi:predicted DNA-binding ArsR family transcriptional regulator
MKQGKTEKAVFAKLSKVELEEQKVELNVGSEIERIASNLDSSKSAANKLLVSAKELSDNIDRELYRAQVNISSDFKTLQKVDNELRSSYKELKGYNDDIDKLFDKVKQAEKSLGRSRDIERLYKKLKELKISVASGTAPFGSIGDSITGSFKNAEAINKI